MPVAIPTAYPEDGIPFYWRNETSGDLSRAVEAYFNDLLHRPIPNTRQIGLIRDFLVYYINAPVWSNNCAGTHDQELAKLRLTAADIRTAKDIDDFVMACLDIGLDPF